MSYCLRRFAYSLLVDLTDGRCSIQDKIDQLILPNTKAPLSMTMSYRDKLNKIGPRKLLACDGAIRRIPPSSHE